LEGDVTVTEPDTVDPRPYVRLAVMVRKRIAEGELEPGDPTPTITRLVQEHGHTRQTCAKALRLLEDEGLLYRVPGFGYYVAAAGRRLLETGDG
jgi:GntR family transcriptional regulator